jgi:hypothetical protein
VDGVITTTTTASFHCRDSHCYRVATAAGGEVVGGRSVWREVTRLERRRSSGCRARCVTEVEACFVW